MASKPRHKRPPENASERERASLCMEYLYSKCVHARYTHHHQLAYIMFLKIEKRFFKNSRCFSSRSMPVRRAFRVSFVIRGDRSQKRRFKSIAFSTRRLFKKNFSCLRIFVKNVKHLPWQRFHYTFSAALDRPRAGCETYKMRWQNE